MPYNAPHDLSPYYIEGPSNFGGSTSNSSSNSSLNSDNSSSNRSPQSLYHHQHQHHHIPHHHHHQQHQQQHQEMKLSPLESSSSFSSMSSLSSSSSSSLAALSYNAPPPPPASSSSASSYLPSNSSAPSFSMAPFSARPDDDVDMQPLDLSVRTNRPEPSRGIGGNNIKPNTGMAEHKPVCMVKACVCSLGNTRAQRLSPYPIPPNPSTRLSRSPTQQVTSSPPNSRTDSPLYYLHRQTSSPSYYSTSAPNSSFGYHPAPAASITSTDSSSFQLLTTSNSVLNGVSTPSPLFRPYEESIGADIPNIHSGSRASEPSQGEQLPQTNQEQEDEEGLTYMDLDTSTHTQYSAKGDDNRMMTPSVSSVVPAKEEKGLNASEYPALHAQLFSHPSSSLVKAHCDSSQPQTAAGSAATYHVSSVVAHKLSAKIHSQRATTTYSCNIPSSSVDVGQQQQQHQQQEQHQQQQQVKQSYYPNSCSPPGGGVSSSTGHVIAPSNLYPNQDVVATSTTYQHPRSNSDIPPATSGAVVAANNAANFSMGPSSGQTSLPPPPPPSQPSESPHNNKLGRCSPSNKENKTGVLKPKRSPSHRTANFFLLPSSTADVGVSDCSDSNNHQSIEDVRTASSIINGTSRSYSDQAENAKNKKVRLLDFCIIKFLSEHRGCTNNKGDKKIQVRLVDLMELQVEQSLQA